MCDGLGKHQEHKPGLLLWGSPGGNLLGSARTRALKYEIDQNKYSLAVSIHLCVIFTYLFPLLMWF